MPLGFILFIAAHLKQAKLVQDLIKTRILINSGTNFDHFA
jgi:hypothetical protein